MIQYRKRNQYARHLSLDRSCRIYSDWAVGACHLWGDVPGAHARLHSAVAFLTPSRILVKNKARLFGLFTSSAKKRAGSLTGRSYPDVGRFIRAL